MMPIRVTAEAISDETLSLINQHTLEPVEREEIFSFSGICSNDRMDSYLTKMDVNTTLRNYVSDLKSGVPLLSGHDISKNPYGRSYFAELIRAETAVDFNAVRGYWYLVRNMVVNGANTDDSIRAIKAGIQKDMSVGFGGNRMWYKCSSCGRDMMRDSKCGHFPGLEDEDGNVTYAWVMEANLREVSTVYKGATPGAFIDKARQYIDQGQLQNKFISRLEREYQVRFEHDENRSFFMPKKEGKALKFLDELREQIRENKIEKGLVYEILTDEGDPFRQPDDVALRNELGKDHASVNAIRQLKKEAQQGRRYLADMIDQAVAARVKASGDTFNVESYRTMLSISGDIDAIREEIDAYEKMAKQRFTPGRQTEEEDLENKDEKDLEKQKAFRVDNDKLNFFMDGDE